MKKTLFGLLLLCLPFLWACGDREQFVFEPLSHAELLRTCRGEGWTGVEVLDAWHPGHVLHRYLLVPRGADVPAGLPEGTLVRTPLERAVLFSSVHAALLADLRALNAAGGVCDAAYVLHDTLRRCLADGRLADMGSSVQPDMERLARLRPDALWVSPFENAGYGALETLGVPIIECADYMETSALGRAEWMKFYGMLVGREAEADSLFAEVERSYRELAELAARRGHPVKGFDAYAVSDVLPGSGLSSSAACEVLLGVIVNHLFCQDAFTPVEIAQMGQGAENVYFGKPSGLMDQTASSVGGAVAIDFADPARPVVRSVAVDLNALGYALCIIDSGASHADLTGEYAAVPQEMRAVAAFFGKEVLREVSERQVLDQLPALRAQVGDRAVLRALHFFADDVRVEGEADALARKDMDAFLALVKESGRSSWEFLQNITPAGAVGEQAMAVALAVAERALKGRGACRVHGGGFAGTIQAFVPLDILDAFRAETEGALGAGSCHVLSLRPVGGAVLC